MEFYGVWVRLCVEIAPSNKEGFLTVFDLVLKDCPTFQLVATCIDHLINLHEEEAILNDQVREYFEAAIRACGSDLFSGEFLV